MIQRLTIFLLLLYALPVWAEGQRNIVAVQNVRVAPYEDALRGVQQACKDRVERYILSEMENVDIIDRIRRAKPDLVLAIGSGALSILKQLTDIPIVYLMVLNPQAIAASEPNVTGVSMNLTAKTQLQQLRKTLPSVRTIGLLYDPQRSGAFVRETREAVAELGYRLIAGQVQQAKDVPGLLGDMKGKIDIFWMLPDLTVVTPETLEAMLSFSVESGVPILSFSDKYLKMGALISIGIDAFDIGVQAGEMAAKILAGAKVKNVHRQEARKPVVAVNLKVARKLGIRVADDTITETPGLD